MFEYHHKRVQLTASAKSTDSIIRATAQLTSLPISKVKEIVTSYFKTFRSWVPDPAYPRFQFYGFATIKRKPQLIRHVLLDRLIPKQKSNPTDYRANTISELFALYRSSYPYELKRSNHFTQIFKNRIAKNDSSRIQ